MSQATRRPGSRQPANSGSLTPTMLPPARHDRWATPRCDACQRTSSNRGRCSVFTWQNRSELKRRRQSIHYLQVALRNTIDGVISGWHVANHTGGTEWHRCQLTPLSPEARAKACQAVGFATMNGTQPEVHGRVITELSFGFWRSLLADLYNQTLWQSALRAACARAVNGWARPRRARVWPAVR